MQWLDSLGGGKLSILMDVLVSKPIKAKSTDEQNVL